MNIGLEKRIFILFFIITFLLVIILISIESQLVRYSIRQYENGQISKTISKIKVAQADYSIKVNDELYNIATDSTIITCFQEKDKKKLLENIQIYLKKYPDLNLIIYSVDNQLLMGEKWDLIERYIPELLKRKSNNVDKNFIANYSQKTFVISFYKLFSKDNNLLGVILNVKEDNFNQFPINFDNNILLLSFPLDHINVDLPKSITNSFPKFKKEIKKMTSHQKKESILRLNIGIAAGVLINYDIYSKPTSIFIVPYTRNINIFSQQSMLIFILILLAITLIMISLLGNWFSKTILHPVNSISDRMQKIAKNPSIIEPIKTKYRGVLGDMVKTFNSMNHSLAVYSCFLKEYKVITDNLDSGVFWLDEDFNIILCNPKLATIFEKKNYNDILHKKIDEFIPINEELKQKAILGSVSISHL